MFDNEKYMCNWKENDIIEKTHRSEMFMLICGFNNLILGADCDYMLRYLLKLMHTS
jgi:hypothetical protein